MLVRILILYFISVIIAYGGDTALTLNHYKHELIEKSFQHADSLNAPEVEKKSVVRAALYSAVIPGTGQYYNGSIWKAVLFAGIEVAALSAYFINENNGDKSDSDMRNYANQNWSEHKYWSWLYDKALTQGVEDLPAYTLTERDQETGIVYLVEYDQNVINSLRYLETSLGHTHRLPETNTQQYYEMIYKYLTQFGNAWGDADFYSTYYGNTNTMTSQMFAYRDMRNQTNEYYDNATFALNVILINHLVSAIEAAWSARSINKDLEINLSVHGKKYFDERVQMYGINVSW